MSVLKLAVWSDDARVGEIGFDAEADLWSLEYDAEWVAADDSFPLSPRLPLNLAAGETYGSQTIRRLLQNLLPEGQILDDVARANGVGKGNVFALIHALGSETTGAFRFLPVDADGLNQPEQPPREVTLAELDSKVKARNWEPFAKWDGQVRMSIAGQQDKIALYVERDQEGRISRMLLPDAPYASTHLVKPEPTSDALPHLVANEHFCMSLAKKLGFPVANVEILRLPAPALMIERFDRLLQGPSDRVQRLHIIDACQALDMPVTAKYEKSMGNLAEYREGVSLPKLFSIIDLVPAKAKSTLGMLRWVLFQLLISNFDAHGKNFSFLVGRNHLELAPWYDLVCVAAYPALSQEYAMAFGDTFAQSELTPYEFGHFAALCNLPTSVVRKEASKLAKTASAVAFQLAEDGPYEGEEKEFVQRLAQYISKQATWLAELATNLSKTRPSDYD